VTRSPAPPGRPEAAPQPPPAPVRARNLLATAVINLAHALLMTGDWDTAAAELTQTADGDGLADIGYLA
jgi:hypothetical protein